MINTKMGSACFNESEGTERDVAFNGYNIVLGKNTEGKGWYEFRPDRHFLTCASNRSGKGATQIIPNLLHYKGSVLCIDPKGELAYITAPRRRELGQKVYILDPWNEVNRRFGEKSGETEEIATFNPLSLLDKESENFMDDLAYIADSIIINQGKEPHFDDAARELVSGLIAYAIEKYGKKASLSIVRQMITMGTFGIAQIAIEAQGFGFDHIASRKLTSFTDAESKEVGSIVSTAKTQTAFLDSPALASAMDESSFSFQDLTEEEATIYLVLPTDKLATYGRWLRLMISFGIRTISRNTRQLEAPVLFVLDEFGTIGKLSAVSQAVGLMAGLQMCVWIFVQDLNQLKRDYAQEWETFLSNSKAFSVLDVMDNTTADYVSKMMGIATEEIISVNTLNMREKGAGLFHKPNPEYKSMKDKTFHRALMTPDEVRRLRSDWGIVISKFDPLLIAKVPYYSDKFFFFKSRSDPYYPDPKEPYIEAEKVAIAQEIESFESVKKEWEKGFSFEVSKTLKELFSTYEIAAQDKSPKSITIKTAAENFTQQLKKEEAAYIENINHLKRKEQIEFVKSTVAAGSKKTLKMTNSLLKKGKIFLNKKINKG